MSALSPPPSDHGTGASTRQQSPGDLGPKDTVSRGEVAAVGSRV